MRFMKQDHHLPPSPQKTDATMTLPPPPPYSGGPGVMEREEPAREPRKGLFLVRRKKGPSYQRQGGVEITTPTYPIPSPSSSTSTVAAPRSSPGGRRDQLGGYDATCVHPSIDDVWVRCDMTSREEREKHQSVGTGRHRHCRRRRRRNRFQDCSDPAMPNSQLQTFAPSPSPPPHRQKKPIHPKNRVFVSPS